MSNAAFPLRIHQSFLEMSGFIFLATVVAIIAVVKCFLKSTPIYVQILATSLKRTNYITTLITERRGSIQLSFK